MKYGLKELLVERKFKPGDLVAVADPEHPFRGQLAVVEPDPSMPTPADEGRVNLVAGKNSFSLKESQLRAPTEQERKSYK